MIFFYQMIIHARALSKVWSPQVAADRKQEAQNVAVQLPARLPAMTLQESQPRVSAHVVQLALALGVGSRTCSLLDRCGLGYKRGTQTPGRDAVVEHTTVSPRSSNVDPPLLNIRPNKPTLPVPLECWENI